MKLMAKGTTLLSWAVGFALLGLLGAGVACEAAATIYTKANAPAAPKLEDLPLKDSVSQYGITWTFDKPARVGQFVNGDYYVVGAVTVKEVDPKPIYGEDVPAAELDTREGKIPVAARLRNGSMVNPPATGSRMAFDSGLPNYYDASLIQKPPFRLSPGDCLCSTISLKQKERPNFPYHRPGFRQTGDNCPTKVMAILTCVAAPLPADAFRPGYCDRQQKIYYGHDLKRERLLSLARLKESKDTKNIRDPAVFTEVLQKPWFNTAFFGFEEPAENMPRYGQLVTQALANSALLLCLDYQPEEKERLLINFAQVGIDYWGLVRSGHSGWTAWGGHGSGRKFSIVMAGYLLGDDDMMNVSSKYPKVAFGEDEQTAYGDSWTGAKVVFTGHSGIGTATGLPHHDYGRSEWGPYEHLLPEEWQKNGLNGYQSEAYRRANTGNTWVVEALVLHLLKLEKAWNHDAFFDYVERWMHEDDSPFVQRINNIKPAKPIVDAKGSFGDFSRQGHAYEEWTGELWAKYRSLSDWPEDGWKKQHDDSYYKNAVKDMDAWLAKNKAAQEAKGTKAK